MLLSSLQFCRNNSITFTVHTQLFLKVKYQQLDENTGKNVGLMLKSTCYFSYEYNKSSESQFSHFYISRASAVICWIQNNRCTSPQLVLLFKSFQEIVLIWTMRRLPLADNTLYYSLCPFLFLFVALCAMIIKIWCSTFVALFSELIHAETGSFCLWKRPCNGCRFSPLQLKERARGLSLNHVTILVTVQPFVHFLSKR